MGKHINRVDMIQRYKIAKELEEHLVKREDNYWEYMHGQSDQTIADRCECTLKGVSGTRLKLFGQLYQPPVTHDIGSNEWKEAFLKSVAAIVQRQMDEGICKLDKRVRFIEAELGVLDHE